MADEIKNNLQNEEAENEIEESAEEAVEAVEEASEDIEDITEDAADNDDDEEDDDEGEDESSESAKKESKLVDDILEIVESTLLTVFVIVMIFTYLLHPVVVDGSSMNDTLFDGNRIFMTTVYTGPHYGDILVIDNNKSYLLDENNKIVERDISASHLKECLIKRVVAEPGQTLMIDPDKEQVIVDGKVLDEPYIKDTVIDAGDAFNFPITIPEGYYFVMGDNRRGSSDSRVSDIGLIKKDQIYGKAVLRYSPIKDFKFLLF
ncbi:MULTISPECIES: signal peptidase I [Ruminococcus]|uniref:Signal peptidase I n=1 Tax=Ruminococcus flavefaciens TaxID=1265 RepID=A0A1M7H5X1_RUMFL|nr:MULTISPECIES: signal peptidase I [Ruminococcus]MCR4795239.1 signal peptidase I [Ruminococcus sp.]SHM23778.1 signal peptidase I [Ruminococcus flavefaciens]